MIAIQPRRLLSLLAAAAALVLSAACGAAPAREPPGDPSTVTSEDLRGRTEPIEVLLQRKVPGLVVTRNAAGELVLQVRGSSSWQGKETPPLYIMDGLPYMPGPGGALTGIDPEDIATVKVLRGPEASIYGIEGANGVIVITTKRGKRAP